MPPILHDFFHWHVESAAANPRAAMVLIWILFGICAIVTGLFLVMRLGGRFHTTPPRAMVETLAVASVIAAGIMLWAGWIDLIWLLYLAPFPAAVAAYAVWERFRPANGPRRKRTRIQTPYLKMILDHAAGTFDGEVTKGAYRGARLSSMTLADLRLLQVEVSSDPDSVNILGAYLDHAHPGAQRDRGAGESSAGAQGAANGRGAAMSEDEARSLLGLDKGASADDVKAAYRRLMKKVHPDHGGTDYLAHKISQAKELLLGQ